MDEPQRDRRRRRASDPKFPEERWRVLESHREHAIDAVRRIVGDAVDAEDCVHDAMLRLVERDALDPAHVRSLLTRAATHIAIDRLRRRRSTEQAAARLTTRASSGPVVSPEQVVTDRDEVGRVLAAVEQLPARERQVMTLRLAGLSVLETARLLGVSVKAVEGAYARARARVRLIVGGVLAWLAERVRRASSPHGEAFAATVAVLVFVGPLWGGSHDRPSPPPADRTLGPAVAVAVATRAGPQAPTPPRPTPRPVGTSPGGGRSNGTSSPRNNGDGNGTRMIVPSYPILVPNPTGPQNPPLYSGGTIYIYQTGPSGDPLGETEQCLAQGGPRISLDNGGC